MESDEDDYSFESSSEEEDQVDESVFAQFLLPSISPKVEILQQPSTSAQYEESSEKDSDFVQSAYQLIEGNLSSNDYDDLIHKKCSTIRGKANLSPALLALVGQANMMFVRGNHDETFRICKEIIRLEPLASEPYRTLSELLEDRGDRTQALLLGILAEELVAGDGDRWMDLGVKALNMDKTALAIHCYNRAVTCNRTLLPAHLMRIRLFQQSGDRRNMFLAYNKLVNYLTPEFGSIILEHARNGAAIMHADGDIQSAFTIMETAFKKVPDQVQLDDVNLISDLSISLQHYEKSLEIISKFCDIDICAEEQLVTAEGSEEITTTAFKVLSVKVNSELPPQLRVKLIIILIFLGAYTLIDEILEPLLSQVEEYGDLLLDIAETYSSKRCYWKAVKLLKTLLGTQSFNVTQVWLQYGENLRSCGRKEEAVEAYLEVMSRAPHLTEPRLVVSDLLNELGRNDEAISALEQEPGTALDVSLLFEKCQLLRDNPERIHEFLVAGRLLISRHCFCIRSWIELTPLTKVSGWGRRQEALKRILDVEMEDPSLNYIDGKIMPTPDEEYLIFRSMCDIALERGQTALLQRLTFSALTSKVLCCNPDREKDLFTLATLSCYFNKDPQHVYNLLRTRITSPNGDSPRAWVLFNIAAISGDDFRHQKFIARLLSKLPSHPVLPMLFANNCYISGSYKQAVSEYLLQLKHTKTPLLSLLTAVCFVLLASQKSTNSMNSLVSQSQAFMAQYRELRGSKVSQEIEYNYGRLHHHLNLLPMALFHYKRALEIPPFSPEYDLRKEAAFNIALIYQNSDSPHLARHYMDKYIVI